MAAKESTTTTAPAHNFAWPGEGFIMAQKNNSWLFVTFVFVSFVLIAYVQWIVIPKQKEEEEEEAKGSTKKNDSNSNKKNN